MYSFEDFAKQISNYLEKNQITQIKKAYNFSALAHKNQKRASGIPYIQHPLKTARILAEMYMDHRTLMAAMLHDVIEDTPTVKEEIKKRFGTEVCQLVDGVSKLTQLHFDDRKVAQAHNFQKMFMAMGHDVRVILVKLADRLHNMRTLQGLSIAKRKRIARETLEIYAPIAMRLGMNNMCIELEELSFQALYPMRHRILFKQIKKDRGNRQEIVKKILTAIKRRIRQVKTPVFVIGREKTIYGIYQKMRQKQLSFNEVYDVYAFRIIVDNVDSCYRQIGTMHNLYKPVPGKFKDYIAIPKNNGYQSLHTVLFGPYGLPIEIQIRTRDMDRVAESGIAAHWLYKSGDNSSNSAQHRVRDWLSSVMELQKMSSTAEEFFEDIKTDLFPNSVYIFSPKGTIYELPKGATAVDMAYAIHTDIGNHCVGVRINRRLASLGILLETGQTVEIITAPMARPAATWLNFVVTAKARSSIRHHLKNLQNDEAIVLGEQLLNRELNMYTKKYDQVNPKRFKAILVEQKLEHAEQLLQEIGLGNLMAPIIARKLIGIVPLTSNAHSGKGQHTIEPLILRGTEGMVISFPKCCYPIAGDPILGFVTAGRGIVIHHQSCKNTVSLLRHPEKSIDVEWLPNLERDFQVRIKMSAANQTGVLASIAMEIAKQNANIEGILMQDQDDRYISLEFIIAVRGRIHLAHVMRQLKSIKYISQLKRN